MRRLWIEPKIKFVSWGVGELRIVGAGIQAGPHEHQFLGQRGKLRIDGNGHGQIRHRPTLVDRHLVRILVHHAHQKMRGVFLRRLGCRLPFRYLAQLVGSVIEPRSPCAQPRNRAKTLLPLLGSLLRSHQGILGTQHHGDVGAPNKFEHSQRVGNFFRKPLIAGHHGDAQDFRLRRLNQQEDRLLVCSSWTSRVLIDDDLVFVLAPGSEGCRQQDCCNP